MSKLDVALLRDFWDYKEDVLNVQFCKCQHTLEQYLNIRRKIREYKEANRVPKAGTWLFTDWYSFKCKSQDYIENLKRHYILMPSDSMLQEYYDTVILGKIGMERENSI